MDKFEITEEMLYVSCENIEKYLLDQLPDEKNLSYNFSNKFKRKMKRLIKQEGRSCLVNNIYKYSKNIAVILMVITIGLFTITMSVEALRTQLFEVAKEVYDKFTTYIFSTEISNNKEEFKMILPSYLPEGFERYNQKEGFDELIITYKNIYGDEVVYNYYKVFDGQMSLDTEDVNSEKMLVNGIEANYIEKFNSSKLTWNDDNYFYSIRIDLNENSKRYDNKKELIKIAENIK